MIKGRIRWVFPAIMYGAVYMYTLVARYLNEIFLWEFESYLSILLIILILTAIVSNIFLVYLSWKTEAGFKASILYLVTTLILSVFWVFVGSMTISQTFL